MAGAGGVKVKRAPSSKRAAERPDAAGICVRDGMAAKGSVGMDGMIRSRLSGLVAFVWELLPMGAWSPPLTDLWMLSGA